MKSQNGLRPIPAASESGSFREVSDGAKIFVSAFPPDDKPTVVIYIISGYTGINHHSETDVIRRLMGDKNQVVVIHPRGTGYSEGRRGDIGDYDRFLDDYAEIIDRDVSSFEKQTKIVLYGHSISAAFALDVAKKLERVDGIILINPPYRMKSSPGMTPGIFDFIKYAFYMVAFPHSPIVNMGGEPSKIINEAERLEAEVRSRDPLLVKYISMYAMVKGKASLDRMLKNARTSGFPLLLIYGTLDSVIEKSGCDEIHQSWKCEKKEYLIIDGGPHGRATVLMAMEKIHAWVNTL